MMKLVKVEELFEVKYGNSLELINCEEVKGGIPFVSRTSQNNGISAYIVRIKGEEPNHANTISVAVGGSVMESFLQDKEYYTGFHVMILKPKEEMTKLELLYYCTALRMNKYRFSYGLQANKFLKGLLIPSKDNIPSWIYQATFPQINPKPLHPKEPTPLDTSTWKSFKLSELFEIKKGERLTKENREEGLIPLVTAGKSNNGTVNYVNKERFIQEKVLFFDKITVDMFFNTFYQPSYFFADDNVHILMEKEDISEYSKLFIVNVLALNNSRFSYGLQVRISRLQNQTIKLPVTIEGTPDWQFMEDYIKALPYSANI